MTAKEAIIKLTDLGFKQSKLEEFFGLPKGKITEILKDRALIKHCVYKKVVDGVERLKEEINNIDANTLEQDIENNYCVYLHTFPDGKRYYGVSCSPETRWGPEGKNYKSQERFWNAIQETGWENIKHEIILSGLSKETALLIERSLINQFKSDIPELGYNFYG